MCKGGGNHWNGLAMQISTSANGLETHSTSFQTPSTGGSGYGNIPQQATGNVVASYHEQHARTSNTTDEDFFVLTSSGQVEVLFDFYSGADRLDVYQGLSKGGENKLVGTVDNTIVNLTDA